MQFIKYLLFSFILFLPVFSYANSIEIDGNNIKYTHDDNTFGIYVYDVGGDFWSSGRSTSQGDSVSFTFTVPDVQIHDDNFNSWANKEFQFYIDERDSNNFGAYIGHGNPLADLSDPEAEGDFVTSFYGETDASGNFTCISDLGDYGACATEEIPLYIPPAFFDTFLTTTTCSGTSTSSICFYEYSTTTFSGISYKDEFSYFLVLISVLFFAGSVLFFRRVAYIFL